MKWSGTPQTVLSMVNEFGAVLRGGPRDVTIDYTSFEKDVSLERLKAISSVEAIGDVALYYLPYVPMLAELDVDIRMPCMRREKAAVVDSFMRSARLSEKTRPMLQRLERRLRRRREITHVNHWMEHDDTIWRRAPKWDKLFPKFDCDDMASAIAAYWDFYQRESERLEAAYPDKFRVFDIETLNETAGRIELLKFCGVAPTHTDDNFRYNQV